MIAQNAPRGNRPERKRGRAQEGAALAVSPASGRSGGACGRFAAYRARFRYSKGLTPSTRRKHWEK